MEACDVLIVGGGPAGSSCAAVLRQAGMNVVLLDKKKFPRNKPCAGWITPQVLQSLDLDITSYSDDHVCQPITGFRCGMMGQRDVEVSYPEPVSYGIRRCEFDSFLLNRAGVRCHLGEGATALERRGKGWIVNGKYSTPLVVGAGGHFCPVARMLGAGRGQTDVTVFAQEAEFRLPVEARSSIQVKAEIPEIYFYPDLSGYGWCFRKGDYINIGIGRTLRSDLGGNMSAFCETLRKKGRFQGKVPCRFQGHAYRLYTSPAGQIYSDGALLVGDAAGLAYPQSGEGIRPAVESGLIAADVIVKADDNYAADHLAVYEAQIEERLGPRRDHSTKGWLPAAWLHNAAARLLAQSWFTRHVVMDRWFLHTRQEALVL